MKKTLALVLASLFVLSLAACTQSDATPEEEPKPELVASVTLEELAEQVDFDKADFATAEEGERVITSGYQPRATAAITGSATAGSADASAHDVSPPVLRSALPPDEVWASEGGAAYSDYGNFTLPDAVTMNDGSLGSLRIPKIGLTVPVYETVDDELESMVNGVAHFKQTSCWDGNVGLAGHNYGVNTYFEKLYTLAPGDRITLTTALGTRNYTVTTNVEIDETDWSYLGRTDNNVITLITCVNHDLTNRQCVQAVEVV